MGAALHLMAEAAVRRALASLPAGADHSAFLLSQLRAIADLDALALRVQRRPPMDAALALDMPVRLSDGTTLWRLSPGALEWLHLIALPWFRDDPEMSDLAVAWAMAHGRDPAAIRAAATEVETRIAVRHWAREVGCSLEALLAASEAMLPRKPEEVPKKDGEDAGEGLGPVLSVLMREYGKDRDYWLFTVSYEEFRQALNDFTDRSEGEANEARKAAGLAMLPQSYAVRAQWAFSVAARALVKSAETFGAGDGHGR